MSDVPGGLERLIDTEARLAEALAAAEAEAASLLTDARRAVAEEEARCQQAFEGDAAALADRVATERDGEMARVAGDGSQRARRLRAVPASVVEDLAHDVARLVLADLNPRVRQ